MTYAQVGRGSIVVLAIGAALIQVPGVAVGDTGVEVAIIDSNGGGLGKGFTFKHHQDCYVITPRHVVQEREFVKPIPGTDPERAPNVRWTYTIEAHAIGPRGIRSGLIFSRGSDNDIAALRIQEDSKAEDFCPVGSQRLPPTSMLRDLLKAGAGLGGVRHFLRYRTHSGSNQTIQAYVANSDVPNGGGHAMIESYGGRETFREGLSGSIYVVESGGEEQQLGFVVEKFSKNQARILSQERINTFIKSEIVGTPAGLEVGNVTIELRTTQEQSVEALLQLRGESQVLQPSRLRPSPLAFQFDPRDITDDQVSMDIQPRISDFESRIIPLMAIHIAHENPRRLYLFGPITEKASARDSIKYFENAVDAARQYHANRPGTARMEAIDLALAYFESMNKNLLISERGDGEYYYSTMLLNACTVLYYLTCEEALERFSEMIRKGTLPQFKYASEPLVRLYMEQGLVHKSEIARRAFEDDYVSLSIKLLEMEAQRARTVVKSDLIEFARSEYVGKTIYNLLRVYRHKCIGEGRAPFCESARSVLGELGKLIPLMEIDISGMERDMRSGSVDQSVKDILASRLKRMYDLLALIKREHPIVSFQLSVYEAQLTYNEFKEQANAGISSRAAEYYKTRFEIICENDKVCVKISKGGINSIYQDLAFGTKVWCDLTLSKGSEEYVDCYRNSINAYAGLLK